MPKLMKKIKLKRIMALIIAMVIVLCGALFTAELVKEVKLTDGEREIRLKTYNTSTESILSQANVVLQYADEVERIENSDTIYIDVLRAFPVQIDYHGEAQVVLVTGGTVADAIDKADLDLSNDDVVSVPIDTDALSGMSIDIDEVIYSKKSTYKTIDYDTSFEYSEDYPKGYEEVKTQGKNGTKKITTTYKYVNGECEGESGKIESIVDEPVSRVILRGTAETVQTSNIGTSSQSGTNSLGSGGVIEGLSYSRVLTGSATAYTASAGALTATGVPAYVGGVAVNPDIIPYGSKLYIVADGYTYGYATAVDTGGALMSGSALVDLYMSTYDECINFGRRNVTVYVLS